MNYTSWCDELCMSLADYAETQYGNHVHLHGFASRHLESNNLPSSAWADIILTCLDVLGLFGIDKTSPVFRLKHSQIETLRQPYDRWQKICSINLTSQQRLLLVTLNRLSCEESEGVWTTNDINLELILDEPEVAAMNPSMDDSLAMEVMGELVDIGFAQPHLTIGRSQYKSTYAGATRISRDHVLGDREIDDLRLQGESDALDYKRQIEIESPTDKAEFTRDVLAFANAGGTVKHILVGVEDDGSFTNPADAVQHQQLISHLNETTLQQIVGSRTVYAPSIRIKARGTHRDGPYALIEIKSDVGHLPYRFFANPGDSKLPGAAQVGEVWVRTGTTKHLATPDEVTTLENRAANYRQLHP